jgi:hypothetical protein
MYFYVFLQPEVFEEAAADGEDATQNVVSILSGFLQNCFLAVFEDDRWGSSVKEKLESWPENMTRRRVKSILSHFKKQKRFLYCITPDYNGVRHDLDSVFEQANSIPLDFILVIASEEVRSQAVGVEVATRRTYHYSTFEPKRSGLAVHGKTCNPGDMDETSFLDFHLSRALRYAAEIHICDRICGSHNLSDNFRYTIKRLMAWLGSVLADPSSCKLIFHLGEPSGKGKEFIVQELTSFKKESLSRTSIVAHFYNESLTPPHQRFILTDQIALNVDRGLDFLDRRTRKCRDTYINCQKPEEAQRLLSSYYSGCVSTCII